MGIALHLCRGNYKGHWMAEGGYEPVAERLFNAKVDTFFLEYDTARAGGFEPLRPGAERQGGGARPAQQQERGARIGRRAQSGASTRPSRYVPLERLAISPQCGFASSVGGNPLTIDDQRRKLARVVEVAELVWR